MIQNENVPKRPLLDVLDEEIKRAMQSASHQARVVNPAQYEVLVRIYGAIVNLIGDEGQINLHPAFNSGGVKITTEAVSLSGDEVSKLREALSECNTLSIEPLVNGNIEIGVTVPDVFYPPED